MLLALLAAEILICLVLNSIVNIFLLLSSIVNIFPHFDLIRLLLQYSFKFYNVRVYVCSGHIGSTYDSQYSVLLCPFAPPGHFRKPTS